MSGVEIRVRANTQQARSELQKVEASVGNIEKATKGLASSIKAAIATYSGFVSIKGIVSAADDFKALTNQLKLVTKNGAETTAVMARLNKLSITSRTGLESTAKTYSRLARSLSNTGRSSGEFLAITEAINKATKLGNQPLATQEAALFQLSQAFSSGVLRGEEFNSVSEGAPEILRALTNALNVSRSELREMAFDGQITSDVLSKALLKELPRIRDEFELLTPLVRESAQILNSEFKRALSEIDKIAGFSESTANKIGLLTSAFSFVADNASYYFAIVKIELLKLRASAFSSVIAIQDVFRSLFSSNFDIESFKTSVTSATESLKQFLGIGEQNSSNSAFENLFSLPTIDASGLLTNVQAFYDKIKAFGKNVVKIFTVEYWKPLVGDSLIPAPFFEDEKEPGQKYTLEGILSEGVFAEFIAKIKSFARSVKAAMADVILGVEVGPGNAQRSGGVSGFFSDLAESISKFTNALKLAITESEAFKTATDFFTTRREAISGFFSSFLVDFNENGGILGYLNRTSEKLDEVTSSLAGKTKTSIDDFLLGTPIGNEKDGRVGGAVSNVGDAAAATGNFLSENKIAVAGAAIASAIILALPSELSSSLAQGALFGAGYVLAAGALFLLTQPLTLAIGGLYFLPNILEFVNTSGLANRIGKTIGDGLVAFFKSDGEGASIGQQIISGIIEASGNFGQGLLDGLFGEEIDFAPIVEKAAGLFAIAIIGFATIGVVKNGLLGVTKGLAKGIFGVAFGTLGKTNLRTQIGGILGVVDDETVKTKAKGRGSLLGKAFSTGMRAAIAGETTKIAAEFALTSFGDQKIDEVEAEAIDAGATVVNGIVIGGTIGSAIPIIGTAVGAVVGGAVAGAFAIATNPTLRSAITDFSSGVYDSISDFLDKIPDKFGELTTAVSEKVKAWFAPVKSFFSDLFKSEGDTTGSVSGFEGLTQEDYIRMGAQYRASGGYISGEGGPKDDKIPAMLSNGEFVIQASAVKKFGAGFLGMINQGMIPEGFSEGTGGPDPRYLTLQDRLAGFKNTIADSQAIIDLSKKSGVAIDTAAQNKIISIAAEQISQISSALSAFDSNGQLISEDFSSKVDAIVGAGTSDAKNTSGQDAAIQFASSFRDGLSEALKSGDFSDFGTLLLDRFTNNVIDSFTTGFTESLFNGLIGKPGTDGPLASLFTGIESWGAGLSKKTGEKITSGLETINKSGDSGFFSKIGGIFKNLTGSLGETITGFLGKLGNGSFDLGGTIMKGLSFLPFSNGGIVPSTPYSKTGADSVPAMLTPGELVVPANKVNEFIRGPSGSSQSVINLSITGDISRQTRSEIVKMLPTIANGVNAQNKENNYKR